MTKQVNFSLHEREGATVRLWEKSRKIPSNQLRNKEGIIECDKISQSLSAYGYLNNQFSWG